MIPNIRRENSHRLSAYGIPPPAFVVVAEGSPGRFDLTTPLYNGVTDSMVSVVNENPGDERHAQGVAPV
jgi:hypothetical protein